MELLSGAAYAAIFGPIVTAWIAAAVIGAKVGIEKGREER